MSDKKKVSKRSRRSGKNTEIKAIQSIYSALMPLNTVQREKVLDAVEILIAPTTTEKIHPASPTPLEQGAAQ